MQLVWMCWVCAEGACGTRGRVGTARAGKGGLNQLETLKLIKSPAQQRHFYPTFWVVSKSWPPEAKKHKLETPLLEAALCKIQLYENNLM